MQDPIGYNEKTCEPCGNLADECSWQVEQTGKILSWEHLVICIQERGIKPVCCSKMCNLRLIGNKVKIVTHGKFW